MGTAGRGYPAAYLICSATNRPVSRPMRARKIVVGTTIAERKSATVSSGLSMNAPAAGGYDNCHGTDHPYRDKNEVDR